jgi:LPPG:FO 2-phospho-L-lactate transferase
MITVLTGGTGGAKFVDGLRRIVPPEELTTVVNTGDDHQWWGLYVSPDIDSIAYVLSGRLSAERGWGVRGDTFHCRQQMKELGEETWFSVGDRDLATHLLRTRLLAQGCTLSQVTRSIAERLGVKHRILPMSDQRVETRVQTPGGELTFEEYFVKRGFQDAVESVSFSGASESEPAPGVLEAIASARAVLIAPSNPVTSIGPILAVPGIREALRSTSAPVVAVSPVIQHAAVSGPAGALMRAQGLEVSIAGVAKAYADFLDLLVADESDAEFAKTVKVGKVRIHGAEILMRTTEDRTRIACTALSLACPEPMQEQAAG